MAGSIFFIDPDDSLAELHEETYDSEALLQGLLARHPSLLAGDLIDSEEPRRWLLIDRELSVVDPDSGGARWFLDHVFLDQDAVPTLVEVKRYTDPRIRREVVGQMLDYAAQMGEISVDRLRGAFEARCRAEQQEPGELLAELLGSASDAEAFWQRVGDNLSSGRIRLLFVSDRIPVSLRRIVEFLNERMNPTEVLALEIRQFVGEGKRTLVPRVIGQTVESARRKAPPSRQWDQNSFLADLGSRVGSQAVKIASEMLRWAEERDLLIWWGRGRQDGSFFPMLKYDDTHWTFAVWTFGRIEIPFQHMVGRPVFGDESKREELRRRLCEIPGIDIPLEAIARRPSVPIIKIAVGDCLLRFLAVWDWYLAEIQGSEVV